MTNAFQIVSSLKALNAAWDDRRQRLVGSCFGIDRVTGRSFQKNLVPNLKKLSHDVQAGYSPQGLLALAQPKDSGGYRIICVPTVADRLVQFSILEQLRPRLKRAGLDNPISFGLVKGKARSVIGARNFACSVRTKHPWVYKSDIQKFFDTLDRSILAQVVDRAIPQRSLRSLIHSFVHCEITDGIERGWKKIVQETEIKPGVGVRQGMPLSPFFAGAYLRDLDRWLAKQPYPAARYVDDIVVFFDTEEDAREFHPRLAHQMEKIGLKIGGLDEPGSKTKLYAPDTPADFLGMEIRLTQAGYRLCVSEKAIEKIGEKFAALSQVSALIEKGVYLTTMGSFLESMRRGYLNAYDTAHNFKDFEQLLGDLCEGTKQVVLRELFGNKIETMTDSELKFVGI